MSQENPGTKTDLTGPADTSPHQYDEGTSNRVEKKPAPKESPQQEHDNEDQG
ncbi:hypothetical protein [Luteibacter sp.]|uniref:hypothetical protein n=1 Tax=Luteibacter sp. TaxID=1886636 RepID=UPI003F7DA859